MSTPSFKNIVVIGAFACVALFGLVVSYAAPYVASGDELVYLTGALQAKEHDLPDAYMLQGMDFGPYLYPKVLLAEYEQLGHSSFKTIYLVILVLATGLAAYTMFRLVGLSWVPALLFSIVALMPRFASGQEIFGVLTFKEAIGRACALPVVFLGTGFLIKRLMDGKSLWPIFGILGFALFLHPVTVLLFVFISLIAVVVTRLLQRARFWMTVREVMISGVAFVLAGSYLFVEVFKRLAHGVAAEGVLSARYVQAITFRNAWEFPNGVLQWYPHMMIVSAFFIIALVAYFAVPTIRSLRKKYPFPYAKDLVVWGLAIAVGAPIFGLLLPGLNLYLMEHSSAPYIFQQWSRLAKFYYLGLFVALVPLVYVLWRRYLDMQWRFKGVIVALVFLGGVLSSSFAFEVSQFAVGYKNFEKAYVPQALSHVADDTTPAEYRAVCDALKQLGAEPSSLIVSTNFAFRYYCKARLYATNEEGSAYQQLTRADVVDWYERFLAQQAALASADPNAARAFARSIDANFIVVSRKRPFAGGAAFKADDVIMTDKYSIMRVSP